MFVFQLNFPGIVVQDIQVKTSGRNPNSLLTFWQQSDVNIANGLDFQNGGNIFIRFTHMQHAEFSYEITVQNSSGGNKEGTCRIFLAPKTDERGNPWLFRNQKNTFIELDKFKVDRKLFEQSINFNLFTKKKQQFSLQLEVSR